MKEVLLGLISKINNKVAMYIVGAVALFSSYCFVMSYLGFSYKAQLIILILVFAITIGFYFYKKYQQSIAGKMLELGILKGKGKQTLAKVQEDYMKEKMADAIKGLKTSSLGVNKTGRAALYSLPWFVIIGPPSNGKSTLLRNSGLNFPFSIEKDENYKIKGMGGTENCDWWFSDQAIFLDLAGKYTQCNTDSDQSTWLSFLSVLKKSRSKAPLNGIIVTLGLTELMAYSDSERSKTVPNISTRIKELYSKLGQLIPIYFVFTKTDRIQGFENFFSSLSEDEKQQIWGVNLTDYLKDEDSGKYIDLRFNELVQQLTRSSFAKMSLERDQIKKNEIFDFPHQFNEAVVCAQELLKTFTKQNPYQEQVRMMGAYFVSNEQLAGDLVCKGSLLNSDNNEKFIFSPQSENTGFSNKKTSYFVNDFFHKLLFKNTDAYSSNKKTIQYLKRLKIAGLASSCAALALLFISYGYSLSANTYLIKDGEHKIKSSIDVLKKSALSGEHLEVTKESIEHYQTLTNYKKILPFYLRLGLYRGEQQRDTLAQLINHSGRNSVLLPIDNVLQARLKAYFYQWQKASAKEKMLLRGNYYTILKAYMMLSFPTHLNVDFCSRVITPLWYDKVFKNNKRIEIGQSSRYYSFVHYYLSVLKSNNLKNYSVKANIALINRVRRQLYSPTNASNLYASIRTRGLDELERFSISQLLNDYGLELIDSTRKIPKYYTLQGWHKYVLPKLEATVQSASEVDWVIDVPLHSLNKTKTYKSINSKLAKKFRAQMIDLYLSEYSDQWLRFLSSIHIQQFASIDDAANQFRVLYQTQGPIAQLFIKLKEQLAIMAVPEFQTTSHHVQKTFNSLKKLANVNGKILESYFKELGAIQSDLERLSGSPDLSRDALAYGKTILSTKGQSTELQKASRLIDKVLGEIDSTVTRNLLKPLLRSPIQEAWRVILLEAKRGLNHRWYDDVFKIYQSELRNKFPFSNNNEDSQEADVVEFFRQGDGILWGFINDKLNSYLDLRNEKFTNKKWLDIGLGLSNEFLNSLQAASTISRGLFKGDKFGFNFYVYPQPTTGLKEILFESGQKYFRYQNGPQEWIKFAWPGQNSSEGALLRLSPIDQQANLTLEQLNIWGVVHLFQKARLKQLSHSRFKASWNLRGANGRPYNVSLIIRGDGRNSILNTLLFNKRSLPKSLFDIKTLETI